MQTPIEREIAHFSIVFISRRKGNTFFDICKFFDIFRRKGQLLGEKKVEKKMDFRNKNCKTTTVFISHTRW